MRNTIGAILLLLWAVAMPAGAQLPAGAIAPDFNVTDINGQSHHLYDILAQDKIVVLEISATWCPPCWSYHQSHALQDFYMEHGPDGDNKAAVFWVEGDPNTNQACIYGQSGCNSNSAGNYADGTPYPILNEASIANAFQITYFPSIFIICPNKKTFEVDPVSAGDLWEKAQVCPVAFGVHNAGIYAHDPGYDLPEICDAVDLAPSFLLTNLGSTPLTSANIFLEWNGTNIQTIEWQGFLPTYGEAAIQFDSFLVTEAGSLNTVITSINNNAGDEDFTNNYKNNSFSGSQHFNQTRVVLKIRTDSYAKETYWELHDDLGNVLEHGGNQLVGLQGGGAFPLGIDAGPGTYSNNTLVKDTLDLPAAGCYSIHFVDAYGDGMCCDFGNGYYKLYNIDNPTIPLISEGQFEAYDRHVFSAGTVSGTATPAHLSLDIQLFPNPARDILYLDIESDAFQTGCFQVWNATGQMVLMRTEPLASGSNSLEMPLQGLPDGFYVMTVTTETGQASTPSLHKFLVQH